MRVFYASSAYRSFARAARINRTLIARCKHQLVREITEAEAVVLHCEPFKYPALYERYPVLRDKYVIACAAWEAEPLPSLYESGLRLVQEVWTPSAFNASLFASCHQNVQVIPHPIYRDLACDADDFCKVDAAIQYAPDRRYFLTIARAEDKRKNIQALIGSFKATFGKSSREVLVIKTDPGELSALDPSPNVITVGAYLTDSQINALYRRAFAYISAHHGEAWGLTISDALLFRLPVLATQWSGNLDYLSESSSFLIPAKVSHINPPDCFGLFEHSMRWAYPSHDDISRTLQRVCSTTECEISERVEAASSAATTFSMEAIAARLDSRLSAVC